MRSHVYFRALGLSLFFFGCLLTSPVHAQLERLENFLDEISENEYRFPKEFPDEFGDRDQFAILLEEGIRDLEKPKHRIVCLKILAERLYKEAKPTLASLAAEDQIDQDIRLHAIHLVMLYRDPELLPVFEELLNHHDVEMRVAGLDAIGYLRQPIPRRGDFSPKLLTVPEIYLYYLIARNPHGVHPQANGYNSELISKQRAYEFPPAVNARLRQHFVETMLGAKDAQERRAAARGLVEWIDEGDELRVAEWGVWISDSENNLQLVKSVLDEIPSFATRTQNLVDDLRKNRVNDIIFVTKPILHFTAINPMSVDVTASISMGQPWFAYPKPNDFHLVIGRSSYRDKEPQGVTGLKLEPFTKTLKEHDPNAPYSWDDVESGFPWMKVPNKFGGTSGPMGAGRNFIAGVGLTWENLIIAPKREEDWMKLESVPEKQKWWSDLREVESDWVSNGDQTERFLYYDGPTLARSPITINRTEKEIMVDYDYKYSPLRKRQTEAAFLDPCQVMLIEVKDGKPRSSVWSSYKQIKIDSKTIKWLDESKTIEAFEQLVGSKNGLTPTEASGILQSWRPQFFETDGTRLIVRINNSQYNKLCPLSIRPQPTEISRVGLVLYEFAKPPRFEVSNEATLPNVADRNQVAENKKVKSTRDVATIARERRILSQARQIIELGSLEQISNASSELRRAVFEVLITTPISDGIPTSPMRIDRGFREIPSGNSLFASDRDFANRNAFLELFTQADHPFESEIYSQKQLQRLLAICLDVINQGATPPPEFAQTVALHLAAHNVAIDKDFERDKRLLSAIIPNLQRLAPDSERVKTLEEVLKQEIPLRLGVRRGEQQWQIFAALLPADSTSRLFRRAIETAAQLDKQPDPNDQSKYRINEVLSIAQALAAHVDPKDSAELQQMTLDLKNSAVDRKYSMPYVSIINNLRKQTPPDDVTILLDHFLQDFATEKQQPIGQLNALIGKLDEKQAVDFADRMLELAKTHRADAIHVRSLVWMARNLSHDEVTMDFSSEVLAYGKSLPEGKEKANYLSVAAMSFSYASEVDRAFMRERFVENIRQTSGTDRLLSFMHQRQLAESLSTEELATVKRLIEEIPDDADDVILTKRKFFVLHDVTNLHARKTQRQ